MKNKKGNDDWVWGVLGLLAAAILIAFIKLTWGFWQGIGLMFKGWTS